MCEGFICAMKEVNLDFVDNISEIEVLEKLPPHPNYVQYFSHRVVDNKMQIFLKQYSGTLMDMIHKHSDANQRFTPLEIVNILRDVADGLHFLHKNKVIHRGASLF